MPHGTHHTPRPAAVMRIDTTTYLKTRFPIGTGYDRRPKGRTPTSIIVHTTNGWRGSSFHNEASFLQSSPHVGAHYLVGKQGQIVELLPPELRAWHSGRTVPGFSNSDSIGIECHLTVGEEWTDAQHDALTWLVKQHLMPRYRIGAQWVDSHRAVALPKGRKIDPSEWPDRDFYAWRAALADQKYVPIVAHLTRYIVTTEVNVRQGPSRKTPIALNGTAVLARGFVFESDVTVSGESVGGNNQWAHLVTPASWGFVHTSCIKPAG